MTPTIRLVAEGAWVELFPLGESLAWVTGGSVHPTGTLVVKPDGLTWADALCVATDGRTALSPLDLHVLRDAGGRSFRDRYAGPGPMEMAQILFCGSEASSLSTAEDPRTPVMIEGQIAMERSLS